MKNAFAYTIITLFFAQATICLFSKEWNRASIYFFSGVLNINFLFI